jgi:hypothetical protein
MPEYEHDLPSSEDPEWNRLVQDVEKRFEVMSDALANLRGAVIRLSSYRPQPQVIREYAPAPAAQASESVAALEDAVRAFEAAATVPEAPAVEAAPVVPAANGASADTGSQAPSADDDAARREEVSRIVAEARGQQTSAPPAFDGSWANASENDEVDSTSEGSWPMARHPGLPISPPSHRAIESESVADLAAEFQEAAVEEDPEEAARREEVARMVAEMRAGLGSEDDAAEDEAPDKLEQDARDEDVATVAVESFAEDEAVEADPEDEDARRESVAETVARMRAEMAAGAAPDDETASNEDGAATAGADDADVRDEVRKAVEAARAEMASGWGKESDRPADGAEKKFSFPDWQTTHIEPSGPPVIVIKDPEGRVELARVYETLSQVNCDENAALLNYTPHSVTVGLNTRAQVPSKEDMERAVEAVFGRRCRVESDGVRVSVDIGADKEDAA